ncbi:Holliday junction branch migration protein RuvA [Anaerosalibacter sp. Marseille-P3206]|uniref:Holliday junction branch migration protein RuvA n=1 Tax=Anaerosalibacter sp. Marseille-P3206 TaxID=1871005 RepID=UPI0009878DC4|nr:Holliday junction branch migration protein RuvA [Anaerosalibacter sp. Marseille-P3206]
MYEYIIGKVVDVYEDCLIVENNNIGYKIYTSKYSLSNLDLKKDVKIYTYLNVREDGIFLFGFSSKEEMEMFELLLLVSKIGPKTAIGVLSTLSYNDIKLAILNNDVKVLCKAPGIGKKTANRIILELKDRIDDNIAVDNSFNFLDDNCIEEAINALMVLGYTKKEIDRVLFKIDTEDLDTEEIIKSALKRLSK